MGRSDEARDVEDYEAWLDSDGQLDLEGEEDPFFSAAARDCNQPAAHRTRAETNPEEDRCRSARLNAPTAVGRCRRRR
jgi:hypothetical protein